jgi:hypothetical protein
MTRPDRIGKKSVSVTVTVEKWKKLRHIVTETERPAGDLISEAIDDLAVKYPTPPVSQSRSQPLPRSRIASASISAVPVPMAVGIASTVTNSASRPSAR